MPHTRHRHPVREWLPRNTLAAAAIAFLACLLFLAIFSQALGLDPFTQDILRRNQPPLSSGVDGEGFYLLGTDALGRDLLARLFEGARVSLMVGVATVLVSGTAGTIIGIIAGYRRGWVDDLLMRLVDLQMSVPFLLIALLVLYVLGPSLLNVVIVLAITRWTIYARVTRGLMLSLRKELFVEAARSLGATHLRIIARHMVPHLLGPVLVLATLDMAVILLTEAALSFLGLGVQPPNSSWGLLLAEGREYLTSAWWLVTFPGLAILFTTLSLNILATWSRERTNLRGVHVRASFVGRVGRPKPAGSDQTAAIATMEAP